MKSLVFGAITLLMSTANAIDLNDSSVHFYMYEPAILVDFATSGLGQSFGHHFNCFLGNEVATPADQIAYRIQLINNPAHGTYSIQASGYHISHVLNMANPVPYTPFVGEPREVSCQAPFIQASLKGQEFAMEFTVATEGNPGPASFDVILSDSPEDMRKLTQIYAPILRTANKTAWIRGVKALSYPEKVYEGVDRDDPVAVIVAATKHAREIGASGEDSLAIIKVGDTP